MHTRTWRSAVALGCLLATGGTALAASPPGHDDPAARRAEQRALALLNRAGHDVQATHASCRATYPRGKLRLVDGGAGPQVTSVLGVFRRPATDQERALAVAQVADRMAPTFFGAAALGREAVRLVRGPAGRALALVALTDVPPSGLTRAAYDRCQRMVAARLTALAQAVPEATLRQARRIRRQINREERPPAVRRSGEGLITSEVTGDGRLSGGGGIAPFVAARFARTGTAGSAYVRGLDGSRLTLVVPDGVATIDATFPRSASRGPHRDPKRYGRTERRTYTVRDNVVFATAPRPPEDAFPRMVWRGVDGGVVRRVGFP